MSKASEHDRRRNAQTVLRIKRHRYDDLVALARKHAEIASEYAEKAKEQLADIEKSERVYARLYE